MTSRITIPAEFQFTLENTETGQRIVVPQSGTGQDWQNWTPPAGVQYTADAATKTVEWDATWHPVMSRASWASAGWPITTI